MTRELYVLPSHKLMHVKTVGLWLSPSPRKSIPTLLELIENMLEISEMRPTTFSLNEETCDRITFRNRKVRLYSCNSGLEMQTTLLKLDLLNK